MDPAPVVQALREVFSATGEEIIAAYLFGSVARGQARPDSDVDVAVLWASTPPATLLGPAMTLQYKLSGVLRREAQVITLNRAPADLTHRVLRDGILLLDRDPSARIRFEVQARNEYFDLEPIRRLYRKLGSTTA